MTKDGPGGTGRPAGGETLKVVIGVFVAVQVAILFCLFNPWIETWRGPALAFLALEAVFLVVLFVPLFLHHRIRRGKGTKESLRASMDSFMNWMGYLVP